MSLLAIPVKFLGVAAVGAAAAIGWKLGTFLVDAIVEHKDEINARMDLLAKKACDTCDEALSKAKSIVIRPATEAATAEAPVETALTEVSPTV